jgi:hypothetical protein
MWQDKWRKLPVGKTLSERLHKLALLMESGKIAEFCNINNLSNRHDDYNRKIQYGIGQSYLVCGSWCVGCGCEVDYAGPSMNVMIKMGKYDGCLCTKCYTSGVEVCPFSFQTRDKCWESLRCFALCMLRVGIIKDLRKLIMSYMLKRGCGHCVKWKAKPRVICDVYPLQIPGPAL